MHRCREISESLRQSTVEHYWLLGQTISEALAPGEASEETRKEWGARVILALESALGVDRTTLWRAVQCFQCFRQDHLVSDTRLSWRKVRLLLPLPEDQRREILDLIYAGKLRTEDDVRVAIINLRHRLGLSPPPPLGDAQPTLFGIAGLHLNTLNTIWRRTNPIERGLVVRELIPHLELERAERKDALGTLRAIRQKLDEYEKQINAGGKGR